jgi:hypothetical protein
MKYCVEIDAFYLTKLLVNFSDLECGQIDTAEAFLNGELKETIYMEPPEGGNIPSGSVIRLRESL